MECVTQIWSEFAMLCFIKVALLYLVHLVQSRQDQNHYSMQNIETLEQDNEETGVQEQ